MARRLFLKLVGGWFVFTDAVSSALAYFIERLPVRTVERDKFTFNATTGLIEWRGTRKEEYRLTVDGMVKEKKSYSYGDLHSFPQVEQVSDFHCVEGWSVADLRWGGFRFRELLNRVELEPKATHVVFHSFGKTGSAPEGQDHYLESFPLSELLDPKREIILALDLNRQVLPEEHGAPLRLIAPYDLGYKSIKCISRIEFTKQERPGWWTLANPIYTIVARVPENRLRKKH